MAIAVRVFSICRNGSVRASARIYPEIPDPPNKTDWSRAESGLIAIRLSILNALISRKDVDEREEKKGHRLLSGARVWVCKPRMKVDISAVVRRINAMHCAPHICRRIRTFRACTYVFKCARAGKYIRFIGECRPGRAIRFSYDT